MGYRPVPSDANFVLFGGLADSARTWQALLDQGVSCATSASPTIFG
jgi:histidinol-phosphate aminotransferase